MKSLTLRVSLLAVLFCALASCGGGSSDSEPSLDTSTCSGSSNHFSGDSSIDELIAPKNSPWLWNFVATSGGFKYTFDSRIAKDQVPDAIPLTPEQRQASLDLFSYIQSITGITFESAATPEESNLRIVNGKDKTSYVTWSTSGASYIILDSRTDSLVDFSKPVKGELPYLIYLQQFGYVLGLVPPAKSREVSRTVMNTLFFCGANVDCEDTPSTFGSKDLLALKWIYGEDGFGGDRGYASRCGSSLD
jgi:hypothetical protein